MQTNSEFQNLVTLLNIVILSRPSMNRVGRFFLRGKRRLWDDFDRWTAGIVRGAWKVMATAAGVSLETLDAMAVTRARGELLCARLERKRVLTQIDRGRRLRLLPGNEDMDKITRYKAHLERCLYRALHELQRLQAARVGLISPPIAVDLNVTGRGLD
jgi:hypothetical protein